MSFLYFEIIKNKNITKQSIMATHLFDILKKLQFGHDQLEGIGLFAGLS